jgi:hypothetical protein
MEYLVLYIAPKEKIQWGYIGGAREPSDWSVPPNPSVWKSFIQRFSHRKATAWRGTILLKENVWLKVCHLRDCKQLKHIEIICTVHGLLLKEEGSNHLMTRKGAPHIQLGAIPFVFANCMWGL